MTHETTTPRPTDDMRRFMRLGRGAPQLFTVLITDWQAAQSEADALAAETDEINAEHALLEASIATGSSPKDAGARLTELESLRGGKLAAYGEAKWRADMFGEQLEDMRMAAGSPEGRAWLAAQLEAVDDELRAFDAVISEQLKPVLEQLAWRLGALSWVAGTTLGGGRSSRPLRAGEPIDELIGTLRVWRRDVGDSEALRTVRLEAGIEES